MDKSSDIVGFLKSRYKETTYTHLVEGVNCIFDTLANSLIVNLHFVLSLEKLEIDSIMKTSFLRVLAIR